MRQLRVESLQWSVGGYCTLVGVLMILAPHLFDSPTYAALPVHQSGWGALLAVAGSAPLAVAILAPPGRLLVAAHFLAGAVLLVMAAGAAVTGGWMGLIGSGSLAVGTLAIPFVTRSRCSSPASLPDLPTLEDHPSTPPGTDLLAPVVATFACLSGILLLVVPGLFAAPMYDASPFPEGPLGALLLASGVVLLLVERRPAPWLVYAVAHWLIAGSLLLLLLFVVLPAGLWTSVVYCTVCGSILGLRPWPRWSLPTPEAISLRARLGLSLAYAAAVPLVLATAVGANREERWIISEFLTSNRALAMSVSANIGDYADQYRAAVTALAERRGLLDYPTEDLRGLLQETRAGYPDALAFGVFRPDGTPIARGDDGPSAPPNPRALVNEIVRAKAPALDVVAAPTQPRPVLAFGAPVPDGQGRLQGVAVAWVEPRQLTRLLTRIQGVGRGRDVFVVDDVGRLAVQPETRGDGSASDPSGAPPVLALRGTSERTGALAYDFTHGAPPGGFLSRAWCRLGAGPRRAGRLHSLGESGRT